MATIKSYSDLQQSKKLAGILPLESADFGWNEFVDGTSRILPIGDWDLTKDETNGVKFFHAWSLAALLGVLPNENMLVKTTDGEYYCLAKDVMTKHYDNPIDACYEMILKLHELNLL